MQRNLKHEIRKGFRDEELSLIIISPDNQNNISWLKPNKEFIHHGEMYDVVRTKVCGDKIHYYCINDQKEKQLIADFNKTHDSKKEFEKKNKNSSITKYFPQKISLTNYVYATILDYGTRNIHYKLNAIAPPSPPPKSA